jgi:hypothetical protein
MYQGKQVVFVVQFFASPLPVAVAPQAPKVNTPIKTNPAPVVSKPVPEAPTVAAAEVVSPTPIQAPHIQQAPPPLSLWTRILSSPRTYASEILFAIGALFLLLLALGPMLSRRVLHPRAAINGLAIVGIVGAILILNGSTLFGKVLLPVNTQDAAVVYALPAAH